MTCQTKRPKNSACKKKARSSVVLKRALCVCVFSEAETS